MISKGGRDTAALLGDDACAVIAAGQAQILDVMELSDGGTVDILPPGG